MKSPTPRIRSIRHRSWPARTLGFAWLGWAAVADCATPAIDAPVNFTVNTTADLIDDNIANPTCHTVANTCSLRAAIMQANHTNTNGMVRIHLGPGTYTLTLPLMMDVFDGEDRGDLNLKTPIDSSQRTQIIGAGAASTIIDGNHSTSVLNIEPNRKVSVADVTVRNGYNLFSGAGIINRGALEISYCVIEGNHAGRNGGGITSVSGTLLVSLCTIRSNTADFGGGISVSASAKIDHSTISGNAANSSGGGLYNDGQLIVVESTLSGNTANADGGGIYNRLNTFLYNASVVDNIADLDHDQSGGLGGGVHALAGSRFVLTNSLIVRNAVNAGFDDNDCGGRFELYGFNLFNHVIGCTFAGNGDAAWRFISSPTSVGPLRDNGGISGAGGVNGGHTLTHALLAGSNAIDSTYDQGCIDDAGITLPDDQRGESRASGQRCDVGAFEFDSDNLFRNGFE